MTMFPSEMSTYLGNVAISDESRNQITYSALQADVTSFGKEIHGEGKLIFLLCANTYKTIIAYLACIEKKCPVLLLDKKIEPGLLEALVRQYDPNIIIDEGQIEERHSRDLKISKDIALLMSTSGTTGSPKLVKLSRKNLQTNADSIKEYLSITTNDVAITSLPFSYSYGLSVVNSYLRAGAKLVLSDDSILSKEFWNAVQMEGVTSFAGVPYTFEILKKLKYERFNTESIRYITQAGGRLQSNIKKYMLEECRSKDQYFIVMYGQTEAAPRMSYVPPHMLEHKLESIGVAIPGGRLFLLDSDGVQIDTPNVEGEICYSGPNVMLGYASSLAELCDTGHMTMTELHTGDLGYFDEDGYFYITGRAKRFIKVFGLRVSLDAVENTLRENGIVACCSGRDDLLLVFTEDTNQDLIEIQKVISSKFGLNQNYIKSMLLEETPRLTSGKVDYKSLIEIYDSQRS